MSLSSIDHQCLAVLADGQLRIASAIGRALWKNDDMDSHGAALNAGRILKRLGALGLVEDIPGPDKRSPTLYQITDPGRQAMRDAGSAYPQQLSLL